MGLLLSLPVLAYNVTLDVELAKLFDRFKISLNHIENHPRVTLNECVWGFTPYQRYISHLTATIHESMFPGLFF